jgi:5S rRNA maturation endonuclease (ribonuclease M5)
MNQIQIYQICNLLVERLPDLLDRLNIEYRESNGSFSFCCPIHSGDNGLGCSIRKDSGYWTCWTNLCHEEFKNTIFGFVRGCLSNIKGQKASMSETLDYCMKFLNLSEIEEENNESKFNLLKELKLLETFNKELVRSQSALTKDKIRSSLSIPSKFYMDNSRQDRNFSKEILDKFDVGDCFAQNKEMYCRAVVPVYDEDNNYVGCIGRTLNEGYAKWKNSKGFQKASFLYGLNFAKESILSTGVVNIVEGQSCIWRLHEANFPNSVGQFGAEISDDQVFLLEKSGALTVIILTDADEAGDKAAQKIIKKCGRRFNYIRPNMPAKDIAELTIEQTKQFLGEVYGKHNCPMWKKG